MIQCITLTCRSLRRMLAYSKCQHDYIFKDAMYWNQFPFHINYDYHGLFSAKHFMIRMYPAFSISLCRRYSMDMYSSGLYQQEVKVGLAQRPGMGLPVLLALQKFPPKIAISYCGGDMMTLLAYLSPSCSKNNTQINNS